MTHKCSICHVNKIFSGSRCKECNVIYQKEYYQKNKEKIIEKYKKYYQKHKKQIKAYVMKYNEINKDRLRLSRERCRKMLMADPVKFAEYKTRRQQYYWKNRKRISSTRRRWRKNNIERARKNDRIYNKIWRDNNPGKNKKIYMKSNKRVLSNVIGKLDLDMRTLMYTVFKTSRGYQKILKYTMEDLKNHIESLFLPGMTWDNRSREKNGGRCWFIRHIKMLRVFNCNCFGDKGFKKYWALENLRPQWHKV